MRCDGSERIAREYSTAFAVALPRRHAEVADSAQDGPDAEELNEVRECLLERLELLREHGQGQPSEEQAVKTKRLADRSGTMRSPARRETQ